MVQEKMTYPKPGDQGGRLMRRLVSFLRKQGIDLPIVSDILIATSGGSDSIALAHLLVHFGRRIVKRENIHLLHVNHHWRADESDADEAFVQALGKTWEIPVIVRHLEPPHGSSGESWEELARKERKAIYIQESQKLGGAFVFTGHQADDLAETLIWRLCTGAMDSHGGGIYVQHECEVRPLLTTRKSELIQYLKEVGQSFRKDSTNESERFLRSRMRKVLMPELERLFPQAVDHLVKTALDYQNQGGLQAPRPGTHQASQVHTWVQELQDRLLKESGVKLRRAHVKQLEKGNEVCLPGGWRLTRNLNSKK